MSIKHILRSETPFDLNNPDICYFLGFYFADGNTRKAFIRVRVAEQDKSILEDFWKLFYTTPVQLYKINACKSQIRGKEVNSSNHYVFHINRAGISEQMVKLGCPENKTNKIVFPKYIPKKNLHHFIRGYFDGDGCFTISKRNQGKSYRCRVKICVNKVFGQELRKILKKHLKLKYRPFIEKNQGCDTLIIGSKEDCEKFYHFIYKDAGLHLTRKLNKFKEYEELQGFNLKTKTHTCI